jgi:hypothetical protein
MQFAMITGVESVQKIEFDFPDRLSDFLDQLNDLIRSLQPPTHFDFSDRQIHMNLCKGRKRSAAQIGDDDF